MSVHIMGIKELILFCCQSVTNKYIFFFPPKDYFLSLLGPNSFKKAIEEAERLSESLKLRLDLVLLQSYTMLYGDLILKISAKWHLH